MPKNDFQSLLSTFKKATTHNKVVNTIDKIIKTNGTKKSLEEVFREIYNTNQIRCATMSKKKQSQSTKSNNMNNNVNVHIAICICIVDTLPHEKIWRYWLEKTGGVFTTASGRL